MLTGIELDSKLGYIFGSKRASYDTNYYIDGNVL